MDGVGQCASSQSVISVYISYIKAHCAIFRIYQSLLHSRLHASASRLVGATRMTTTTVRLLSSASSTKYTVSELVFEEGGDDNDMAIISTWPSCIRLSLSTMAAATSFESLASLAMRRYAPPDDPLTALPITTHTMSHDEAAALLVSPLWRRATNTGIQRLVWDVTFDTAALAMHEELLKVAATIITSMFKLQGNVIHASIIWSINSPLHALHATPNYTKTCARCQRIIPYRLSAPIHDALLAPPHSGARRQSKKRQSMIVDALPKSKRRKTAAIIDDEASMDEDDYDDDAEEEEDGGGWMDDMSPSDDMSVASAAAAALEAVLEDDDMDASQNGDSSDEDEQESDDDDDDYD